MVIFNSYVKTTVPDQRINVWDFHGWRRPLVTPVIWSGSEGYQLWEGLSHGSWMIYSWEKPPWPAEVCSFDAMVIHCWHITRGREWPGPPKQGPPQGAAKGPIFHGETNGFGVHPSSQKHPRATGGIFKDRGEPRRFSEIAIPTGVSCWVSFFASHFA